MKASVRGKSKEGVLLFIGVQARHADRVTLSRDLNGERAGALNISSVCLAGRTASAKALAGACLRCSSFILLQVVDQFSQHHLLKKLSFLHCIFLLPKIRCL